MKTAMPLKNRNRKALPIAEKSFVRPGTSGFYARLQSQWNFCRRSFRKPGTRADEFTGNSNTGSQDITLPKNRIQPTLFC